MKKEETTLTCWSFFSYVQETDTRTAQYSSFFT